MTTTEAPADPAPGAEPAPAAEPTTTDAPATDAPATDTPATDPPAAPEGVEGSAAAAESPVVDAQPDGSYIAHFPSTPDVKGKGKNPQEAIDNIGVDDDEDDDDEDDDEE